MPKKHKRKSVYFSEPIDRYLGMVGTENYSGALNTAIYRYLVLVSDFPNFTKDEWLLICNAIKFMPVGTLFYRCHTEVIAMEVNDYIKRLDQKFDINVSDLLIKIAPLSKSQAFSVLHVVETFWNCEGEPGITDLDALKKSGLKIKD